jgi:hypothetical protein
MALYWFALGLGSGLALAWLAEWVVDWRHRNRDRGVDGAAMVALQASLARAEAELALVRASGAMTSADASAAGAADAAGPADPADPADPAAPPALG